MAEEYEYRNVLARQMKGPSAQALMKADHELYKLDDLPEWFEHRRHLSLETATTEELDLIGKFLGIPRPWCTSGVVRTKFTVEKTAQGYVANTPRGTIRELVQGIEWELKNYVYDPVTQTLAPPTQQVTRIADDETYKLYIQNMAGLRRSRSIMRLADMLYLFNPTGTFEIEFQDNGDILIYLEEQYEEYYPFLQIALNLVYNALPHLGPIELVDYRRLVVDDTVRTQYFTLLDPDWMVWVSDEEAVGYLSCTDPDKVSVVDGAMIEGTDKSWIVGEDGEYGSGNFEHTLFITVGE